MDIFNATAYILGIGLIFFGIGFLLRAYINLAYKQYSTISYVFAVGFLLMGISFIVLGVDNFVPFAWSEYFSIALLVGIFVIVLAFVLVMWSC